MILWGELLEFLVTVIWKQFHKFTEEKMKKYHTIEKKKRKKRKNKKKVKGKKKGK